MSTITLDTSTGSTGFVSAAHQRRSATKRTGLVARLVKAMIESRQAQADRAVADHLAHYSDAQLLEFGYTPNDVAHFRRLSRVGGQRASA